MRRPFPSLLPRLLPRLTALLAALLFVLPAVAGPRPAAAAVCVQATSSVADAVGAADAVVTAKVTRRVAAANRPSQVHYVAQVTASFKGNASGSIKVVTQTNSCNLARLVVGTTYLLFLNSRHQDWIAPASLPSSSNVAMLQPQVEAALAPPVATFGEPLAGEPARLRRVAAPGVALVIIGLLGLLFVRRSPRHHHA